MNDKSYNYGRINEELNNFRLKEAEEITRKKKNYETFVGTFVVVAGFLIAGFAGYGIYNLIQDVILSCCISAYVGMFIVVIYNHKGGYE